MHRLDVDRAGRDTIDADTGRCERLAQLFSVNNQCAFDGVVGLWAHKGFYAGGA